jgi:hypothetical protein
VPVGLSPPLEGDVDRQAWAAGISPVVQVIAVAVVGNVDIVSLIPIVSPVIRVRIHEREPIAAVLESRHPAIQHEGHAVDTERVIGAVVAGVVAVGDAVAAIAAALLPGSLLISPAWSAMLLPDSALLHLLSLLLLLGALLLLVNLLVLLLRMLILLL